MPSDYIKVIEQLIREARPDLDIREFTALHDLLIKPHSLLLEPLQTDIATLKESQSLASTSISDTDIDSLVANLFLSRRTGSYATGIARVYVTTPATLVFDTMSIFVASNGTTFAAQQAISFPEALVRLNADGSLYFVDVPVIAQDAGESSRIAAHRLSSLQGSSLNYVKVDNPYPFSGGVNRETNEELKNRAVDAVTVRDLVSGRGVITRLQQTFAFIDRIFVAGYMDPEQQRDLVDGIHVGGKADIRIKPVSLLADQIKLTSPESDGTFILSSGGGAPGDDARPVVFVDSVRLLGPGPSYEPIGTSRSREEATMVSTQVIVDSGEYKKSRAAINTALNHIFVISIEVVSPQEKYISLLRTGVQGDNQIEPTRLSEASADVDHPYVAVNPSNNRVYAFWVDGGTVYYKVLNTSGSTLTVLKDTTILVAGGNETLGGMSSTFSSDGHIHVVFTQRTTDADLVTVDSVWYARLDASGEVPGPNTPKQAVFDLPGDNGEPSVVVHGSSSSLVVTIVFSSKRITFSNVYALQLDSVGEALGLPVALTSNYEWNDQPTIKVGTGEAINVVFRLNRKTISFMRIQKTGLVTSLPRQSSIVRDVDIDELGMIVNPYGYPYVYWSEYSGYFDDIFSAKLDIRGQRIGPVHDLSDTPYFSSFPTLLSDSSGALHLIWIDGVKGVDKPFYLKRLPQEWRLIVEDSKYRYSTSEKISVAAELPAANGIGIDLRWADLLPQVQDFVVSNEERTIVADLLVRHQTPATVSCDVYFGPKDGTLTAAAAKAAVEDYINNLEGESLVVSSIINTLYTAGATSVAPFVITIKIDGDDGVIQTLLSDDVVTLPRGVSLTAFNVTATLR